MEKLNQNEDNQKKKVDETEDVDMAKFLANTQDFQASSLKGIFENSRQYDAQKTSKLSRPKIKKNAVIFSNVDDSLSSVNCITEERGEEIEKNLHKWDSKNIKDKKIS